MEDEKNMKRSHYYGWPTHVEDRKNVKWSHCYGWPTQMKDEMWQVWKIGLTWRSPEGMIEEGPENLVLLDNSWSQVWKLDASWLQGWSFHFFEIFLTIRFIPSSSRFKVTTMILCYYQLNDSFFVHNLAGLHWGSFCNKSQVCAMLWG
jgi:hypothetical protein